MRLLNVVTGFFPLLELSRPLELDLDSRCNDSPGYFASVLFSYLGQFLLDELVEYPVFLADIMSHDGLPVWVVFVVAAGHGTDVGFLGGQVGSNPLLEVVASQVILEVTVRVLGCRLELTDWTNLHRILSGVPGNPH